MSQTPITVTYSLEEILSRIEGKIDDFKKDVDNKFKDVDNKLDGFKKDVDSKIDSLSGKIDNLSNDINGLKVGQARLEEKLTAVEKDITDLKSSQKAQIWTLIGVLGTAVVGTVIRFVITALPGNP